MRYGDLFNEIIEEAVTDTLGEFFDVIDVHDAPADTLKELLIALSRNDAPLHTPETMYLQYGDIEGDVRRDKIQAEIAQINAKAAESRAKSLSKNGKK